MRHALLLVFVAVGLSLPAAEPVLDIVPAVREWKPSGGLLEDSSARGWNVRSLDPALGSVASMVAGELIELRLSGKREGMPIELRIDPTASTHPEGHVIEITDKVVIRGPTPTAVFYGSRSVLQLLGQTHKLPKGTIRDWPDYQRRMLMLDVGRKPYSVSSLRQFLRMMAWYKMNELHLHLSDEAFGGEYAAFRIESKTFPGLAAKDLAYSREDLRNLQVLAKELGITITPEIDMPGHARCFTQFWPELALEGYPNYLDVTKPQAIERMKQLLDEMIPLFDAPDFHIGTDEYRVSGPRQAELHEAFRQFINTMNAHVRSKGRNCRIWSGFEHMKGTTEIDPTVIIDMWETDDAKGQIAKGHSIINSNHGRTYIVPGCHYYGINRGGIYEGWEPWMVSGDASKNPARDDPKLLGGKLHVWFDQGPTGWTMAEVADTTLTGLQPFAEKLWGTKGSPDYKSFTARTAKTLPIPGVGLLTRLPSAQGGVLLEKPEEVMLKSESDTIPLALAQAPNGDREYPWTLVMEVKRTADTTGRGVLLSSDLAEICARYSHEEERTTKAADGTQKKEKVKVSGLGTVRAAGSRRGQGTPAETYLSKDVSKSCETSLPLNQWATLTVVGEQGRNSIWLNGRKILESPNQMVCPLRRLGGGAGQSFVGSIRRLRVLDRAFTPKEIARAAGLEVPDNLAENAKATATATDTPYGYVPENATDGNPATRWSSGITKDDQSLTLDLGMSKTINRIDITWETAVPKDYRIQVSPDGKTWRKAFAGEAVVGKTIADFPPELARYIRVEMSNPRTGWGYSIFEVEAFRTAPGK